MAGNSAAWATRWAVIAWAESQGMPPHEAVDDLKLQLQHIDVIKREEKAARP